MIIIIVLIVAALASLFIIVDLAIVVVLRKKGEPICPICFSFGGVGGRWEEGRRRGGRGPGRREGRGGRYCRREEGK